MIQCLIKKDRYDQSDATMADFYEKLVTAYRDPSLVPVQYSGDSNRLSSPLLQTAEVWSWEVFSSISLWISKLQPYTWIVLVKANFSVVSQSPTIKKRKRSIMRILFVSVMCPCYILEMYISHVCDNFVCICCVLSMLCPWEVFHRCLVTMLILFSYRGVSCSFVFQKHYFAKKMPPPSFTLLKTYMINNLWSYNQG